MTVWKAYCFETVLVKSDILKEMSFLWHVEENRLRLSNCVKAWLVAGLLGRLSRKG